MTRGRAPTPHVALIRAINVRGHQTLRMDAVRAAFAAAGCKNVRTCRQSGNVIFEPPQMPRAAVRGQIRRVFRDRFDAEPQFLLRSAAEMQRLADGNPFSGVATAGPRVKLYVAFLFRKPQPAPTFPLTSSSDRLTAVSMAEREVFLVSRLKPNGFFGFPNNFIEEALGVPATTRNWSTVMRIAACVSESVAT
jgi:uncharacterized protein (DUF1697 family)